MRRMLAPSAGAKARAESEMQRRLWVSTGRKTGRDRFTPGGVDRIATALLALGQSLRATTSSNPESLFLSAAGRVAAVRALVARAAADHDRAARRARRRVFLVLN